MNIDMYPDHEERGIEWMEVAEKLFEVQKLKKHFAQQELMFLQQLKDLSDDLSSKGGNFVFTAARVRANIDYHSIPELEGVDLEPYRKPVINKWKLTKI